LGLWNASLFFKPKRGQRQILHNNILPLVGFDEWPEVFSGPDESGFLHLVLVHKATEHFGDDVELCPGDALAAEMRQNSHHVVSQVPQRLDVIGSFHVDPKIQGLGNLISCAFLYGLKHRLADAADLPIVAAGGLFGQQGGQAG
jgi:hypothetical protein